MLGGVWIRLAQTACEQTERCGAASRTVEGGAALNGTRDHPSYFTLRHNRSTKTLSTQRPLPSIWSERARRSVAVS